MTGDRDTVTASLIVLGTGAFWGLYWLPVRALEGMGAEGAWGTLCITVAAIGVLLPLVAARGALNLRAHPAALISIALGGVAFALYSVGFVYGRVAIIILLYFLTPVWSTLIARFVMGWPTPPLRILAIGIGLLGLAVMFGTGGGWPMPRGAGEWMALAAGILWSVSTTGIRTKSTLAPLEAAFIFAVGAAIGTVGLMPFLDAPMSVVLSIEAVLIAGATGGLWWVLSIVALMWATVRLEPARVGILLMSEVLVGAVSAAMLAGEYLSRQEMIGGGLVLFAGILEIWPAGQGPNRRS